MKSLLVLMAVVGAAMCQWAQPEHPRDTPEVAAAKAAHFAALAQVQNREQAQGKSWAPQAQSWSSGHIPKWNGPIALPPGYDANGAPLPVQDTPEVAAERAKHFYLFSSGGNTFHRTPAAPSWNNHWGHSTTHGLPKDTPEVAAAKAAHFAAHAQVATHGRRKRGIIAAPAVATISAHSTSIVHSATPIVRAAPIVYTSPVVHATPILRTIPTVHSAPLALGHW